MVVFRPELSAFPLQAFLDQASEELGADGLAEILGRFSITRADLADASVWVSMEFVDAFLRALVERSGDETFLVRAAVRGVSRRYMGPIYPLLVGVGSAQFVYKSFPRSSGRMDKLGSWSYESTGAGHVRMIWKPVLASAISDVLCPVRLAQLAHVPALFSQSLRHASHSACFFHGAPACVFEITWDDRTTSAPQRIGMLLGAACGSATAAALGAPAWGFGAVAGGFAVGGWALGKVAAMRADAQLRLKDIDEQRAALDQVSRKSEERYAELLEAKGEVDQRVEERTRELHLATQQLSETLQQLQELDRAKTGFFANVSHDLRTPLTLILGPLGEMAAGREPPGGLAQSVQVMQRNGMRLLELINQLLDLAKIDAGKMEIVCTAQDIRELMRVVAGRFLAAASQRGVELELSEAEVATVAIDATWIEAALTNLVANALRYARSKVRISARDSEGSLVLEVQDDGAGIPDADQGKVFDRFAQGSDQQLRKGGTGLGLAIVREAARLHGGEATVRSEPGVATVFALSLPRIMSPSLVAATTSASRERSDSAALAAQVFEAGRISSPQLSERLEWPGPERNAPVVLVVEDEDDLRAFIAEVLATSYRVHAVRNGEEALVHIDDVRPDAVVSDVMMPSMNGFELCRRLRARDSTRHVPIILLTARRDTGRVLEGFEAGADDYLTKPFQARELLARVGVHVRLRRMVSEMAHRARLASLGVLAASLAHQVRNPLNAIVAGLPAVRRKLGAALAARDDEIFQVMIDSGERIHTLINDLMDLSRVDQEAVSTLRPADGVRACVRLIEARLQGSVQIDTDLDDALELEGKPGDLSHVFLNLIDNAVRAADKGGRVFVRVARRGETVVFETEDSGPGIPPEKHESIFTPFYTTRPAGEGTGLGLAIARQVVLQHGGTIAVGRSALGGALLRIALPLIAPRAPMPAIDASLTMH